MENENRIFEELKSRLKDYTEEPDRGLRKNIENRIDVAGFRAIKVGVIAGIVLICGVITALILAPASQNGGQTRHTSEFSDVVTNQSVLNMRAGMTENENADNTTDNRESDIQQSSFFTEDSMQITQSMVAISDTLHENTEIIGVPSGIERLQPVMPQTETHKILRTDNKETTVVNDSPVFKATDRTDSLDGKGNLPVPNAFWPDGVDERVKTFKPIYREVRNFEMQIFARNGMKVFSTKDITLGWDGTVKGQSADRGTYVYYIVYEDTEGQRHTQRGTLWLHR